MKNNHGSKQRQCWEVLVVSVSCSLTMGILPSAAPCQAKEAFEEKVVEVGQDTSSGICGYVISGYRTHKKEHGTRLASASGNPLLFQWQRAMLACFQI